MCTEFSVKYRWLNLTNNLFLLLLQCMVKQLLCNNCQLLPHVLHNNVINIRSTVIPYHIKNKIHLHHSSGLLVPSMRLTCYHI